MAIGDRLLPALLQRGKERRTESRRQDRLNQATTLFNVVQSEKPLKERRQAALQLQGLGYSVDNDLLKAPVKLDPFFDMLNIPEKLREPLRYNVETGLQTVGQALALGAKAGKKPRRLTLQDIKDLKEEDFFQQDIFKGSKVQKMTAEQIDAYRNFGGVLVEELGVKLAGSLLGPGGKDGKLTTIEEKQQVFSDVTVDTEGGTVPLGTLLKDPGAMGALDAAGFDPKKVMAIYGVSTAMYSQAEESIMRELSGGLIPLYEGKLRRHIARTLTGGEKKRFDEAVDLQGGFKPSFVVKRMNRMQQAIIDQSDMSRVDIDKVPMELRDFFTFLAEKGFVSQEQVRNYLFELRAGMLPDQQFILTKEQETQLLEYFSGGS